jgi:succinylglutamate desuccinylase
MYGTAVARQKVAIQKDHVIASFAGNAGGPTLIVVGSIHGNEPSGAEALRMVANKLKTQETKLDGRVFFLEGNVRALAAKVRFIDTDLNRHWTKSNLGSIGSPNKLASSDDHELRELSNSLDEIVSGAKDEVYVLDLHTTSADGLPFATVGDTLRNRHFAQRFPVTMLLGIEEQLEGTLLEYLNNKGAVTLGFEGGQHNSASAVANHESLIWLALVNTGIISPDDVPDLLKYRQTLEAACGRRRIVEIRHREAVTPSDSFVMRPGFNNFDPVGRGEIIAHNKDGYIKAVEGGMILMPLYQKKGEDGFFIGREVAPFWIRLSEVLRRFQLARWMYILPGVRRHATDAESLIVNTAVARFFPLQIFHLLGFRKRVWEGNHLIVSRRKYDTQSPFVRQKRRSNESDTGHIHSSW